jgi:hypothetical protein
VCGLGPLFPVFRRHCPVLSHANDLGLSSAIG